MKKTLKNRLIKYLESQTGFIASGELQRLAQIAGYSPANATRRLRECVEDGLLEVEYRKPRNHAYYRFAGQPKKQEQIIIKEVNGRMTACRV